MSFRIFRKVKNNRTLVKDILEANNKRFLNWIMQQANAKLMQLKFKFKENVCAKFVRERKDMMYTLSHKENVFRELDFLKRSNITFFPAKICNVPHGIPAKKSSILFKGLLNLCLSCEKSFWKHWNYKKMQLS